MEHHEKNTFHAFASRGILLTFIACFLLFPSRGNGDPDGKGHFKQGREDLKSLRYSEAIINLSLAAGEYPLLGDYALYFLAEAYHGAGDHKKALETIQSLLKSCPATPLRKKVRMAEIREAKESGSSDMVALYEAYTKEYPEDEEALFLYGKILSETGNTPKASSVFKKVYIDAGEFSHAALAELKSEDIKTTDIVERAPTSSGDTTSQRRNWTCGRPSKKMTGPLVQGYSKISATVSSNRKNTGRQQRSSAGWTISITRRGPYTGQETKRRSRQRSVSLLSGMTSVPGTFSTPLHQTREGRRTSKGR
jgi:tetratricopeptide (TPR) repeat protein